MRIDWSKLGDLILKVWPLIKEILVIISASGVYVAASQGSPVLQACGASVDTSVGGQSIFAIIAGLFAAFRTGGGIWAVIKAAFNLLVNSGVVQCQPTKPVATSTGTFPDAASVKVESKVVS